MNEIQFQRQNHIGFVTLNRPQALNALTPDMILALQHQLLVWEKDTSLHAVVVQGAGEKAFCAGGDIRWLYDTGLANNPKQHDFFLHEYRLNYYLHCFKKPYIALLDGVTMGGGVGVSLHGSHPIATERFMFAMPETAIGFFPDIGASFLLNRCPGATGVYLGLMGTRLFAEEALDLGLVCAVLPSTQISSFLDALLASDLSVDAHLKVDECLAQFKMEAQKEFENKVSINKHFTATSMEAIVQSLEQEQSEWSNTTLQQLAQKSPLSLKVTLEQLRRAKNQSMAKCIQMDYQLVQRFMQDHDFYEGVRALIVDKDKTPKWKPASLEAVNAEKLASYFEWKDVKKDEICSSQVPF